MKRETFNEALNGLDQALIDEHIREREALTAKPVRKTVWKRAAVIAACAALIAVCAVAAVVIAKQASGASELPTVAPYGGASELEPSPVTGQPFNRFCELTLPSSLADCALRQAEFPVMPEQSGDGREYDMEKANAYFAYRQENIMPYAITPGEMADFLTSSASLFLAGMDGENRVFAPLNAYMGLAMLAETTDGTTRAQLLDLLGADSIETLRARADRVWRYTYRDDGLSIHILASSLWLNRNFTYNKQALDILRDSYQASVYAGEMGSEAYDAAMHDWLNHYTGGLLESYVDGIRTNPDDVLHLFSTTYFHANWQSGEVLETMPGVFHAAGGDMDCTMLTFSEIFMGEVWEGRRFTAVRKYLDGNNTVWLILPKEGVTVDELLADEQAVRFAMLGEADGVKNRRVQLHAAFPAFDMSVKTDMKAGLTALGVTECFTPAGDFSALTEDEGMYVEEITQSTRLIVNKEGVTGGAMIQVFYVGAPMPPKEILYFTCDRPFLCVVTAEGGLPVFAGVVNRPEAPQD